MTTTTTTTTTTTAAAGTANAASTITSTTTTTCRFRDSCRGDRGGRWGLFPFLVLVFVFMVVPALLPLQLLPPLLLLFGLLFLRFLDPFLCQPLHLFLFGLPTVLPPVLDRFPQRNVGNEGLLQRR